MGIIPTGGKGRFNVDVKNVNIAAVATLNTSELRQNRGSVKLWCNFFGQINIYDALLII